MRETIFNIHDLVLMMTSIQCVSFVLLLLVTNPPNNRSNYWLAAFLVAQAFIPLHELVLWGASVRGLVLKDYPELFFWMGFGYFIDGPLLYFYVKSLVYRDFKPGKLHLLHLIPVVFFFAFLAMTFYNHTASERAALIEQDIYVYSAPYLTVDFLGKLGRLIYCAAAIVLITKYKGQLKATHSNIERVDVNWLNLLALGFLLVTSLGALLALIKIIHLFVDFNPGLFEVLGLTSYYAVLLLILMLVFSSMRYFTGLAAIKEEQPPPDDKLFNKGYADKIDAAMREGKFYLQPDLTLDGLAEGLQMSAKDLSLMFNRYFQSNFYEFVNGYRIEEAKRLLADPTQKDKTINQIYLAVGFNSKSVFNTFFKKIVGKTPSEFRFSAAVD